MRVLEAGRDANWVFDRYEQIRDRLPQAGFPEESIACADLGALTDEFDVFVFDSYGVLNVGATPVAGAHRRIGSLRDAGKQLIVLTNGATQPLGLLPEKYREFGYDFTAVEIVSSREVLADHLAAPGSNGNWGVLAPAHAEVDQLPGRTLLLDQPDGNWDDVSGFVLLSSTGLDPAVFARLGEELSRAKKPVLVGNPDLVAPRESGVSLEPGAYAHDYADEHGIEPVFFGKPFGNAFEAVSRRIAAGVEPRRIAMIGDTLHTDILGGAAAGMRTVLVTEHGVLRGMDVDACIARSGIVPDFIIPGI